MANDNEIRDKVITHRVFLEYQKNRIVNESLKNFKNYLPDFKDFVKYLIANDITKLNPELEKELLLIIQSVFKDFKDTAVEQQILLGQYESSFQSRLVDSVVKDNVIKRPISKSLMRTLIFQDYIINNKKQNLNGVIINQSLDMNSLLKRKINEGLSKGIGRVGVTNSLLGVINLKQNQLDTLVRTNINNAVTMTNVATFEERAEFVKKLKWSSILDVRTTDICRRNNGRIVTIEESKGLLPAHWNCRAFWIPVLNKDILLPDQYSDWKKTQSPNIFLNSKKDDRFEISKSDTMTLKQQESMER